MPLVGQVFATEGVLDPRARKAPPDGWGGRQAGRGTLVASFCSSAQGGRGGPRVNRSRSLAWSALLCLVRETRAIADSVGSGVERIADGENSSYLQDKARGNRPSKEPMARPVPQVPASGPPGILVKRSCSPALRCACSGRGRSIAASVGRREGEMARGRRKAALLDPWLARIVKRLREGKDYFLGNLSESLSRNEAGVPGDLRRVPIGAGFFPGFPTTLTCSGSPASGHITGR
jgi:hypothetical protein